MLSPTRRRMLSSVAIAAAVALAALQQGCAAPAHANYGPHFAQARSSLAGPAERKAVHIEATIVAVNYDARGIPDGIQLSSGDLALLNPVNVPLFNFAPGQKVVLDGIAQPTYTHPRLIEPHTLNGIQLHTSVTAVPNRGNIATSNGPRGFEGTRGGPGNGPRAFGGMPGGPNNGPRGFEGMRGGPGNNPRASGGMRGNPGVGPRGFGGMRGGPGFGPGGFGGMRGGPGFGPGGFGGMRGGPGFGPRGFGGMRGGPGNGNASRGPAMPRPADRRPQPPTQSAPKAGSR